MTLNSEGLEPCPCGKPARIDPRVSGTAEWFVINCTAHCGFSFEGEHVYAGALNSTKTAREKAIAAWNRRSPSLPSGDDLVEAQEIDAKWRDLALQFDGHRMEAMSMLKFAVASMEEYRTVRDIMREPLSNLKAFIAAPPLPGEKVLAQRIGQISATRITTQDAAIEALSRERDEARQAVVAADAEQGAWRRRHQLTLQRAEAAEARVSVLTEALEELERLAELLAASRTRSAYLAMIEAGQSEALMAFDVARRNARTALHKQATT